MSTDLRKRLMELDNSIEKPRLQGSCRVAGECETGCVQRQGAAGAPKEWVCGGLQTNHGGSAHPLVIGRVLAVAEGRLRGVCGVEKNELRCESEGHSQLRSRPRSLWRLPGELVWPRTHFFPFRGQGQIPGAARHERTKRKTTATRRQDVKNGITAAVAPESGIIPGGGAMSMWNRALENVIDNDITNHLGTFCGSSTVLALAGTTGKRRHLSRVSTWFRVKIQDYPDFELLIRVKWPK
ncbi:hypothetical protein DFH08DRAFT_983193 [Mycena albidolilacea]|uniref:Uncharacterized protein n=1 Tax=Mycena albidolilacea TaxID=1033008 RepID=A0AAD7F4N9_9AGAR|nr:hypothetical protein DFH08DRAFT_983193 [Mycena albidolilacea]